MFFVVVYHCSFYNFSFFENSVINYFVYYLRSFLSVCIPLFFFVNGYLLFYKPFDLKKHIYKIIRLIVLTIVWSFVLVIITMLVRGEFLSIKEIFSLVLNMEFSWTNILWFLGTLVCVYVFFPLLKVVFDSYRKIFIYFTLVCAILCLGVSFSQEIIDTVAFFLSEKHITINDIELFNIFNPFNSFTCLGLLYFCIGGLVHSYQDLILSVKTKTRNIVSVVCIFISSLFLFLLGVMYSYSNDQKWDIVWKGYNTVFTFINVNAIFVLSLNFNKDIKLFRLISMNTMGIYFTHIIIIRILQQALIEYDIIKIFQSYQIDSIIAVIVILISFSISLVLKKIPILKILV